MSVVLSVNVGMPREVQWQGRTVRTAIWKLPVAGRVMARRLNLDGDGQGDLAGHGGEQRAAMVYQLDSYRYWERYLERSDFAYGQFGENLTVDGLADTDVCIGDRFRIGGAVFEVTQPRVTCYRVGIRMDHPEMPALLVSHHRPGFYFRVIEEGEIGAGDRIAKIADGPEQMTVAEVDALLYTRDHPAEALQRALRIPALSPGWQDSFKALLTASSEGKPSGNAGLSGVVVPPRSWRGFRQLEVMASSQESRDVRSFVLAADDGSRLPASLPGQHIVVKLRLKPELPTLTRNYSLSGLPDAGSYRIGVKSEEGGLASTYLHEQTKIGDMLQVSAPRGSFTLASGTGPVVLLSAGVGVTPVLAMLHACVSTSDASPREIWWIHGARDGEHHAFAHEARDLIKSLKLVHCSILYSRPQAHDRLGRDYGATGHIDLAHLQRLGVPQDANFHLCGPSGLVEDLSSALRRWGVAGSRIHAEVFGPAAPSTPGVLRTDRQPPHVPAGAPGTGPIVTFARSGLAVLWDRRFRNLLEFAEACDVPARWSCRTGVCHNCECALIEGELRYSPDPLDPPADGDALICCSTPVGDVHLDL